MTAGATRHEVGAFFDQVGGATLRLPSRWFGRPYDNLHRLSMASTVGEQLVIGLEDDIVLVLAHPKQVTRDGNVLRVEGYVSGCLIWDEYDSSQSHIEVIEPGVVEFVAPPVGTW